MRWIFVAFVAVHALLHLMGFAKAFGLAELTGLALPISRPMGVVWLLAAAALLATGVSFVTAPSACWLLGLTGVALSQVAITTSWADARFGTLANVLVLGVAVYGLASLGPSSFASAYDRAVADRLGPGDEAPALTELDLAPLPEPVRRYVRITGAVGRPRVHHFAAVWRGRIRSGPDDPWMEFTARQHNFVDEPARFFHLRASRSGVPVDVLHTYAGAGATMRVRLASLIPLVSADGPELTRAETVTLFNDLCVLAPAALVDARIHWLASGEDWARAEYTVGSNTVSAELRLDEAGRLIDFVSEDRLATADGHSFTRMTWSTPLAEYRDFGGRLAATRGEGLWHAPGGVYSYIEVELLDLTIGGGG